MKKPKIIPLEYKVVVQPVKVEEKTAGGIIIPDTARDKEQAAAMEGMLVAKSPYAFQGFENAAAEIGQRVLFSKYVGQLHVEGDEQYRILNDKDIIAILED